jgi:glycosyltransferase involved in cell wall biosynthesis
VAAVDSRRLARTEPRRFFRLMTSHICFYRSNVAALVSDTPVCAMGGADLRAWEFARRLATRQEFRVSFVVGDYGQPAVAEREGVAIRVLAEPWRGRVATAYRQYQRALRRLSLRGSTSFCGVKVDEGASSVIAHGYSAAAALMKSVPWLVADRLLRVVRPSEPAPRFDPLLSAADPDVVVCFGATPDSAYLIEASRRARIPSVLCITGDSQLRDDLGAGGSDSPSDRARLQRVNQSLAAATELAVQTEAQQRLVHERFGRRSHLVRNPTLATPSGPAVGTPAVLWVGRAELVHKRPDRIWEIARKCASIPFRVVLNPDFPGIWERLASDKPANVELIDRVPAHEMGRYYASASLLANTSASEGFPNAFLQAASFGVPVISWEIDPDGFLDRHGCGICCGGNADKMAAEIARLWHGTGEREAIGRRAREYVATYHDPERCTQQFADLLLSLTKEAAIHAPTA